MINPFRWIFNRIITGGNSWLRDYEASTIEVLFHLLPAEDKIKLLEQLKRLDIVQRSPNGKVVQVFELVDTLRKHWSSNILLPMHGDVEIAFRFKLYRDTKSYLNGIIYVSNGALTSLEYSSKPEYSDDKFIKIHQLREVLESSGLTKKTGITGNCSPASGNDQSEWEKKLLNDSEL